MLYKITGETPFQVDSDTLSISPSESGYDLYISADGVNYSNFVTVAPGVTKQMVSMNSGNFYKLVGNTSVVTVNWNRDCSGGGGGGTAGVSSLDGQTGALTTKTINGNAILGSGNIEIEGGGGYVIVDALSAITSPKEGMIAYVSSGEANWTGWEIENDQTEGYVAWVKDSGETENLADIYRSGDDYHWGWDNDGDWHEWSNGEVIGFYRKNLNNNYFDIVFEDASLVSIVLDSQTYTKTPITKGVPYEASRYEYKDGAWVLIENKEGKEDVYLNELTSEEITELYNSLSQYSENTAEVLKKYNIYYIFQEGPNGNKVFVSIDDISFYSGEFLLRGSVNVYDSSYNGVYEKYYLITLAQNNLTVNADRYCNVAYVDAEGASHSLKYDANIFGGYPERMFGGNMPISLKISSEGIVTTNCNISSIVNGNTYLYAEWVDVSGTSWEAKWRLAQNETPIYFREKEEKYVIVDSVSGIGESLITYENYVLSVPTSYISGLTGETLVFIGYAYPHDTWWPFKLQLDDTNFYLYGGDDNYDPQGSYTLLGSGTTANGANLTTDWNGNFKVTVSISGGYVAFTFDNYAYSGLNKCYYYIVPLLAPNEGQLAYEKTSHSLKVYDGTSWRTVQLS